MHWASVRTDPIACGPAQATHSPRACHKPAPGLAPIVRKALQYPQGRCCCPCIRVSKTRSLLVLDKTTKSPHLISQPRKQQQCPDISLLSSKLQQQWDNATNAHLGNILITPHSRLKVHWTCPDCPDGHPHRWEAKMTNRTNNDGCPFCKGRRVCQHNSVANKAPDVAASWDSTANEGTPHDFTAASHFKKQWHCPICGHKWLARINNRIGQKSGCPECDNLNRAGPKVRHATLTECNHALLKEWDSEANAKEGLFPDKLTLGSNKHVHWLCHKCPLGLTHKWVAQLSSRALRGIGCSCCGRRTACKCNSLPSLYPDIAQDWDYSKNDGKPSDYTAKSHAVVWWKSSDLGSWQQSIHHRTDPRLVQHQNKPT
ncbi:TPA: hypothetical protein ACH3X2_003706 [Trebouxia sp. C0005]